MEPRDNVQGKDRLDRWLDAALREYGSAEPRMGLEGRVLANLAAERTRSGVQRWWAFGAAALVACAAIVVWVGGMNRSKSEVKVAGNTPSAVHTTGAANGPSEVKRPVVEAAQRRMRPHSAKTVEITGEPRLSQFPSPRGLSEQEQLLVRYVTESPSEAVLIANEQAERQKELEKLSGDESSKIDSDR